MRTHQQPTLPQHSSKSNEHYTPAKWPDAARLVMGGIDLDPASCELANEVVQAERIYTKADDGLLQPWHGRVWCNPPYGYRSRRSGGRTSNKQVWVDRCVQAYLSGEIEQCCLLVTSSTGDGWFRPLWSNWVCFPYERISFYGPDGSSDSNPGSSAVVYLGPNGDAFRRIFSPLGRVVPPEYAPEKQLPLWDHEAEWQQFRKWSHQQSQAAPTTQDRRQDP